MRQTVIILALLVCSFIAKGQEPERKYIFNLGGGYSKTSETSQLALSTRIGAIAYENFAFGIEFGYLRNRFSETSEQQLVDAGPFLRYYFFDEHTAFFVGGEGSFASLTQREQGITGTQLEMYQAFLYGPNAGINIFLNQSAALELLLHYQFEHSTTDDVSGATAFTVEIGITLFL